MSNLGITKWRSWLESIKKLFFFINHITTENFWGFSNYINFSSIYKWTSFIVKVCVCSFGLFKTGSHSVARVSLVLSWQSSCLSPGNAEGSLWWATMLGFCPGTGTVFLVVCRSSLVTVYDHLSGWSSLGRGVVSSRRVKLIGLHVTSSSLSSQSLGYLFMD